MSHGTGIHRAVRFSLLAVLAYSAVRGLRASLNTDASDFGIYYRAGEAVLAGRDCYSVKGYIYLPFFAVCAAPLALFSHGVAATLWQILSLLALAKSASIAAEFARGAPAAQPDWLDWAPLACVLRLADSDLGNGQVNSLILLLVLAGLRAWRAQRERIAGAWIGFALALKILPGCVVLFFIVEGARRAIASTAATALICVLLVPTLVLGWSANAGGLVHWFRSETMPYVAGGEELLARRPYVPGQSLTAAAYRSLERTPANSLEDGTQPQAFDLEPSNIAIAVWLAQGVILAALLATLARSRQDPSAWLHRAALVMTAALLLAPLVHKAHMVWLIFPFAVLLRDRRAWRSRLLHVLRWALVSFAALAIGATAPALLGRWTATLALAHNCVFFGALAVFAALVLDICLAQPTTNSLRAHASSE